MADETELVGTWQILECVSLTGTVEPTGIEGTEIVLDESGDVFWKVPESAEPMPFFSCETYESVYGEKHILKLSGPSAGHIIEFSIDIQDDLMLLTYEHCCILQCQKISSPNPSEETPFSFAKALEEGFFSDVSIKAANGKEFKVHTSILNLSVPEINWEEKSPLTGLPEDVLHTILYYMYAECLPAGLGEATAQACITAVSKVKGYTKFVELCQTFLKNTALKQQIKSMVEDMHTCCERIIDLFNGKSDNLGGGDDLASNPTRLCYIIKQALREGAVAAAKLVILSDLFSRRKAELSREERHDIIKYVKTRLPVFFQQMQKFVEVCKKHCAKLTATQRHEIASHLVPEIETCLNTMSTYVQETKAALDQVIKSSEKNGEKSDSKVKKGPLGEVLGRTLKHALHVRELVKLKNFSEKIQQSLANLMEKREIFLNMSHEQKVRTVSKNLEHLIDELPTVCTKLNGLETSFDDKLKWRDWKYIFKQTTSRVAWILSKLQGHRATLSSIINQCCDIVHRDQFTQSLVTVGLLDRASAGTGNESSNYSSQPTKYAQLSTIESLCKPPPAKDSHLALGALELLKSKEDTDMVFEIIVVQESGDVVIDHSHGEPITRTDHQKEVDIHKIPAHCVVITARCDWFRRALLSGMRESIDKKITVHDTNPDLFQLFLEYLYCGRLDTNELAAEQLSDIMALSDRYEMDCLKCLCEVALKQHLDEESCLVLLSLADQYNARMLKRSALSYICDHPDVLDSDVYEDLPEHLQTEAVDAIANSGVYRGHGDIGRTGLPGSGSGDMEEMIHRLESVENRHNMSSSSEETAFYDEERMQGCIENLRTIVGDDVPREELVRVILAADYNAHRAINFFFS